jgi:hypothetical protein
MDLKCYTRVLSALVMFFNVFSTFGDTAMPVAPSIFVVGLFGPAQIYDIDRLQIMSKVEVKRIFLKFCHATLAQWDSTGLLCCPAGRRLLEKVLIIPCPAQAASQQHNMPYVGAGERLIDLFPGIEAALKTKVCGNDLFARPGPIFALAALFLLFDV